MSKLHINMLDIARSGHVTRWHSVRCARNQTLAEHHYLVTMITRELLKRIMGDGLSSEIRLLALEYALTHDAPELLMGDLPSPLKKRIALMSGEQNPLLAIEDEIAPELAVRKKALEGTPVALIVKLADLMDGCLFIREEGIGRHATIVADKCEELFREKLKEAESRFPELEWSPVLALFEEMSGNTGEDNRMLFE